MKDWLNECVDRHKMVIALGENDPPKAIVEVGVEVGAYSCQILEACKEATVYLVDPWLHQKEGYQDGCNVSQDKQDEFYQKVLSRVAPFGERAKVIRDFSETASRNFQDSSLDLVYLDGNHSQKSVESDIANWYPKIRPGGILAGHDYSPGNPDIMGVIPAVQKFVNDNALYLVNMTDIGDSSWAVRKPRS